MGLGDSAHFTVVTVHGALSILSGSIKAPAKAKPSVLNASPPVLLSSIQHISTTTRVAIL